MVGVVGSSPIVPTKQTRFWRYLEGDPKGSPFLFWEYFGKSLGKRPPALQLQVGPYPLILDRLLFVSLLIVGRHLAVGVAHQRLHVFGWEVLLFI